jgi:type 1 glutamine amidotransferase
MRSNINKLTAAAAALCLGLGAAPTAAQTKPAESTSKVKKVLLYNLIGGWRHVDGIADVKSVMTKLAAAKGFQLTQTEDPSPFTVEYLKQFQVIVWNNNTNGASSVPSNTARQAIIDYVNQGGGWFLIHGAGDHANSWTQLTQTLGTSFTRHGNQGAAEFVVDNEAKEHPELKFMVQTVPATVRLTDEWYSFQNTVRPLPGVTVVATARPVSGVNNVIVPVADGSNDLTYIWAREVGKGRMLYNAVGHGQNQLMAQQDSVVPKLYWENLRYAAGDFQNGCTTQGDSKFNAGARVHVSDSCSTVSVALPGPSRGELMVTRGATMTRVAFPHAGSFSIRLRDVRGALVWQKTMPAGTSEIQLGEGIKPGVYHLEVRNGRNVATQRLALQ